MEAQTGTERAYARLNVILSANAKRMALMPQSPPTRQVTRRLSLKAAKAKAAAEQKEIIKNRRKKREPTA